VPDQPPPTMAEIAEFHSDMARGLQQACPDAWHGAAARRLEEADFSRSVMLAVLGQFYRSYVPGANMELDQAWAEAGALSRNETPGQIKLNHD
jgi:hypothetical protein